MSQLSTVVGHELQLGLRDRSLAALLILFVCLCLFGAWNGARWAQGRADAAAVVAAEVETAMVRKREDLAKAPPGKPPFSAMPETMPFRPTLAPGNLAPLSIGQSDAYPYAARFQPLSGSDIFASFTLDIDNPAVRAAGRFDLAFVIVFLLPLMILASTFDLWSRERDNGVAAMILSQPVGPGALLLGKALAKGLLLLPAAIAVAIAALISNGATDAAGLSSVAVAIGLYGALWIGVATLINVYVRQSTEAAVACGVAWVGIVVLSPALALSLADVIAPPPSATQYGLALRAESTAIRTRQRLIREAASPDAGAAPDTRIPARMRAFYLERTEEDRLLTPRIEAHRAALDRRRHILNALRTALPAVAAQDALDRIAGSDADRAMSFQDQVVAFKARTRMWLSDRLKADQPLTAQELGGLPRFAFQSPPGGPFQRGVLIDFAVLLGFVGLAFAGVVLGRRASTTL